jgi:D-arabinose 1-dehydrogenase-like Zn-dependent alcohol dehydrogenase
MKALIFRETGEQRSVLKLAETSTPPLAPGEVLVRMLLSPINPSDLHMVRGGYGYQPELPASPGAESVGIVEAVGSGVQGPIVGTRVVFVHTLNTWRQQIVCPVDKLVPVPDGLDDPAAATSYTNPLTAWALTRSSHNLKEGDWLLQTAAASSVELAARIQNRRRRLESHDEVVRSVAGKRRRCRSDQDPSLTIRSVIGSPPVTNGWRDSPGMRRTTTALRLGILADRSQP